MLWTLGVNLRSGGRALLLLAAVAVIATGIKLASALLAPLVVAWCLAAVAVPAVNAMGRRGVKPPIAVLLTMLGALAALGAFSAVLLIAAQDVGRSLPRLERSLIAARERLIHWLEAERVDNARALLDQLRPSRVDTDLVTSALTQTHELAVSFSVVVFVLLFILLEVPTFRSKLKNSLGWRASRFQALQAVAVEMQRYLVVKTWLSLAMGIVCGVWCWVLDIDYPVLWGCVTFLLNYIPVIGALIATVAPAAMALLDGGVGVALLGVGGLLIIHNVVGNLVEPAVLGRAIHLSPLVIVLSLVIWGWLLGPVGALLSVPLTTVVKFLLGTTDDLRWVAILLGSDHEDDEPDSMVTGGQTRRSSFEQVLARG